MTTGAVIEALVALALIGAGIWLYRRPSPADGRKDTQGAVLLLIIGAIVLIHALGGLDYRPSSGELAP